VNAALFAAQILGGSHPEIRDAVRADRQARTEEALDIGDPREG